MIIDSKRFPWLSKVKPNVLDNFIKIYLGDYLSKKRIDDAGNIMGFGSPVPGYDRPLYNVPKDDLVGFLNWLDNNDKMKDYLDEEDTGSLWDAMGRGEDIENAVDDTVMKLLFNKMPNYTSLDDEAAPYTEFTDLGRNLFTDYNALHNAFDFIEGKTGKYYSKEHPEGLGKDKRFLPWWDVGEFNTHVDFPEEYAANPNPYTEEAYKELSAEEKAALAQKAEELNFKQRLQEKLIQDEVRRNQEAAVNRILAPVKAANEAILKDRNRGRDTLKIGKDAIKVGEDAYKITDLGRRLGFGGDDSMTNALKDSNLGAVKDKLNLVYHMPRSFRALNKGKPFENQNNTYMPMRVNIPIEYLLNENGVDKDLIARLGLVGGENIKFKEGKDGLVASFDIEKLPVFNDFILPLIDDSRKKFGPEEYRDLPLNKVGEFDFSGDDERSEASIASDLKKAHEDRTGNIKKLMGKYLKYAEEFSKPGIRKKYLKSIGVDPDNSEAVAAVTEDILERVRKGELSNRALDIFKLPSKTVRKYIPRLLKEARALKKDDVALFPEIGEDKDTSLGALMAEYPDIIEALRTERVNNAVDQYSKLKDKIGEIAKGTDASAKYNAILTDAINRQDFSDPIFNAIFKNKYGRADLDDKVDIEDFANSDYLAKRAKRLGIDPNEMGAADILGDMGLFTRKLSRRPVDIRYGVKKFNPDLMTLGGRTGHILKVDPEAQGALVDQVMQKRTEDAEEYRAQQNEQDAKKYGFESAYEPIIQDLRAKMDATDDVVDKARIRSSLNGVIATLTNNLATEIYKASAQNNLATLEKYKKYNPDYFEDAAELATEKYRARNSDFVKRSNAATKGVQTRKANKEKAKKEGENKPEVSKAEKLAYMNKYLEEHPNADQFEAFDATQKWAEQGGSKSEQPAKPKAELTGSKAKVDEDTVNTSKGVIALIDKYRPIINRTADLDSVKRDFLDEVTDLSDPDKKVAKKEFLEAVKNKPVHTGKAPTDNEQSSGTSNEEQSSINRARRAAAKKVKVEQKEADAAEKKAEQEQKEADAAEKKARKEASDVYKAEQKAKDVEVSDASLKNIISTLSDRRF